MGAKHRLLIVDDEIEICNILKEVGEQCGYEVKEVTSANEFPKAFKKVDPTFIMLDLNMPHYDGIELLRYLAQHNCTAPILLESGQDQKVIEISKKLGQDMGLSMAGYFQKPLNLKEIASTLLKYKDTDASFSVDFLKNAIKSKQVVVHYQPQVSFKTKKIEGIEALARLIVDGQVMPPSSFIPLAEETNLIRPLSQQIIQQAFRDFSHFLKVFPHLNLSVNLSPKLLNDLFLPDEFYHMAKKTKVDTSQICLEITETAFMEQRGVIADIITRFRIKGFVLSIDDFGTGFASLSELHKLPFNELKIDQSFVKQLVTDSEAQKITRSVVSLGHSLGLKVIAEGVETKEVWNFLEAENCDLAQGFFICHPLDAKTFQAWLIKHKEGFIIK